MYFNVDVFLLISGTSRTSGTCRVSWTQRTQCKWHLSHCVLINAIYSTSRLTLFTYALQILIHTQNLMRWFCNVFEMCLPVHPQGPPGKDGLPGHPGQRGETVSGLCCLTLNIVGISGQLFSVCCPL